MMPTRRRLCLTVLGLCLALVSGGCSRRPAVTQDTEESAVVPVAAQPAELGRLRSVLHLSGIISPAQGAEFLVIAPEPARILEITKAVGDTVAAGETLVRFDLPAAAQEAARQRAEVARLQAQVESARLAHNRATDLVGRGLMPRVDLDIATRELADAEGALAGADTLRTRAEAALARATIRAPFAARVAGRLHDVGDVAQANPGDPVLRLVDPTRLEVLATIPRADVPRVLPGASARMAVLVDGKQARLSVASQPNPAEAGADGSVRVRLAFAEPTTMAVDTPVEIDIDAEERANVVFIPAQALIQSGTETAVFVAVGNTAQRRVVRTGVSEDAGVEITDGVAAGELIITRGHNGLSDGAAISVGPLGP